MQEVESRSRPVSQIAFRIYGGNERHYVRDVGPSVQSTREILTVGFRLRPAVFDRVFHRIRLALKLLNLSKNPSDREGHCLTYSRGS